MPLYVAISTWHTPSKGEPPWTSQCILRRVYALCWLVSPLALSVYVPSIHHICRMGCKGV